MAWVKHLSRYLGGAPMNAGSLILFSAIDFIIARVTDNVFIASVGMVQSVGVVFRHRGHSRCFCGIIPVRR